MPITNPQLKWLFPDVDSLYPFGQLQRQERKGKRQRQISSARGLKTSAAAEYLGISPWSIRQLVYRREIPVIRGRHWLFDVRDLDAYLEHSKTKGASRNGR